MKVKELLRLRERENLPGVEANATTSKEEEEPVISLESKIDPTFDHHQWYEEEIKLYLDRQKNTPWALEQRKAIEVSATDSFKLRKKVCFFGLSWPIGTKGRFLSKTAFSCLSERSRAFLKKALEIPDTKLCSLGDYIYVLPKTHLRYSKLNEEETFLDGVDEN